MPVHDMEGQLTVVEIKANSEITVKEGSQVVEITCTDGVNPFNGRPQPDIRLVIDPDKWWEMVSKINMQFLTRPRNISRLHGMESYL